MAHKYSNFISAFIDMLGGFANAKQRKDWATTNAQLAYSGASDPVDKLHFGYLCYAVEQLAICFNYLAGLEKTSWDQSHLYESVYWAGIGGGNGEVTMDSILTAMLSAEYDEIQQFVGIVDAYRVALWDTWFNTEFYAALAHGFKQLRP